MMFKQRRSREKQMDSIAAEVTRSAALTDDESEAAIASPLLFSHILSTIEREQKQTKVKAAVSRSRILTVDAAKLALSGLSIVAAVLFWLVRIPVGTYETERQQAGPPAGLTACSITAATACTISTGDVLQLLLSDKTQELPK